MVNRGNFLCWIRKNPYTGIGAITDPARFRSGWTVTVKKVYLNDTPENSVIKVIKIIVDTYSIKVYNLLNVDINIYINGG